MADNPSRPEDDSFTADILSSAAHSAVRMPYDGLRQLANKASNAMVGQDVLPRVEFFEAPEEAPFRTARWHGQQIGAAAGMAVPMFVMTRGLGLKLFAPSRTGLLMQAGKGALVGASYDFLFRPTEEGANFWHQRMENAALGGLTMGTMAGSGGAISRVWARHSGAAVPELAYSLRHQVLNGTASGAIGGFVHAEADALWKTGKPADGTDVLKSMYGFAFTGGAMGGLHRAADRLGERAKYSMDKYFEGNKVLGTESGITSPLLGLMAQEKVKPGSAKSAREVRDLADDGRAGWSAEEQSRVLGELKRTASGSRLASEGALDMFVRILNKQAKTFSNPELAQMEQQHMTLREAYLGAEKKVQDVIMGKKELRFAGDEKLADPQFQDAHPQYKAALEARNEAQKAMDAQRVIFEQQKAAAEANIQMALNEFTSAQGLPPIRVMFDSHVDVAAYWFGTRQMSIGYSTSKGLSARQAELLLHELTHYEQDIVRMRLTADKMGIGKEATAEQMAEFKRQEEATVSAFDEGFFREVMRRRNGKQLTTEETARAEKLDLRLGQDPFKDFLNEMTRQAELSRQLDRLNGSSGGALRLARRFTSDRSRGDSPYLEARELFGDQHQLVEPILDQVRGKKGSKAPAGWDEAANKRLLKQVIEEQIDKAHEGGRKHFFDYVRQAHETEAYSVGLLANLKARAMGLSQP